MKVLSWYLSIALVVFSSMPTVYEAHALPATTSAPTTHIVSYVNQKKTKAKYDEFPDFDFESIRGANKPSAASKNLRTHSKIVEDIKSTTAAGAASSTSPPLTLDDLQTLQRNTLENEIFAMDPEHHESPQTVTTNGTIEEWQRNKQNIPVLETVRHLVHSVRDGHLNHTTHVRDQHRLLSAGDGGDSNDSGNNNTQNEESVIETEEEREMANESTSFQLLDFFGTIGGMIWTFIMNLQRIFAASSSNASASSSFGG